MRTAIQTPTAESLHAQEGGRGREGQGLRQRAPRHPAGSPSLMLRAGRRCSQSRSVHTLKVRVTQRGQGSIVRPHLPVALSVVWGDPGPARRPRGEGLGPQSTSGLSPPPGLRTTGVAPRPRPAPPRPGSGSPEASAPRPRPKRAVGGEQAFLRRPPPPPAAAAKPAAGLHRAPGAASPPGPRRRPGGFGDLAPPPRLPDASSRRVLRASLAFRSRRL